MRRNYNGLWRAMEELDKPILGSKACSRCGVVKSLMEFYRKGTKLDYACKACKRGARKHSYTSAAERDAVETVTKIARFIAQHELAEITKFNRQFEEFLTRCERKEEGSI